MDSLPDKIVSIDALKIRHNMRKICACENPQYDVDANNRAVWCRNCGAWIDPYDAIEHIAKNIERLNEDVQNLLEQRRQIENYKPHLVLFKKLEREYIRSKDMLPICPACGKPFDLAKISSWVNKKYIEVK
jgi:rubrerythrin